MNPLLPLVPPHTRNKLRTLHHIHHSTLNYIQAHQRLQISINSLNKHHEELQWVILPKGETIALTLRVELQLINYRGELMWVMEIINIERAVIIDQAN
jgi:hypothetical protein